MRLTLSFQVRVAGTSKSDKSEEPLVQVSLGLALIAKEPCQTSFLRIKTRESASGRKP
jgi:hypothetical protein